MKPTKTSDVLQAARALIANEKDWCRWILSDAAGRMCALGAVNHVVYGRPDPYWAEVEDVPAENLLDAVAGDDFDRADVTFVNNLDGHAATMRMFDIAISLAMGDEAAQ